MSTDTINFAVHSEADTARLGASLGKLLLPGTLVTLDGPLGAGKTRFVQAVAAALGINPREVTSPTFVLVQQYEGRLRLFHVDVYRLTRPEEFLDLGIDEALAGQGVVFIEWAERVDAYLPPERLAIRIEVTGPDSRHFWIKGYGDRNLRIVDELRFRIAR